MTTKSNRLMGTTALTHAAVASFVPPSSFDGGGPDDRMDGRTDIAAGPPGGPTDVPPATDTAAFNAAVDRAVETRMSAVETRHREEAEAVAAKAETDRVLACLQTYIDGNPGDDAGAAQFREKIREMSVAILSGDMGDKPPKDFLTEAAKLSTARMQTILAAGGDSSGDLAQVRRPQEGVTDGRFDIGVFMHSLGQAVIREGDKFDGEKMTGAPELEFAVEQMNKLPWARDAFAAISADLGRNQRVVPMPAAALVGGRFAETYGSDAANQREPTYRRDALVPFARPANVLRDLGVAEPTIANDITLPRLSAAPSGGWYAETGDISDEGITVSPFTTSPKRFGVRDDISWMLLAAGDAQFGVQPVVVSEMQRAWMAAKTAATLGAAITNGPTGIRGTSNINTKDLGSTDPTYVDLLNMMTVIANKNIDLAGGAFCFNWTIKELLSTIQRFGTGSQSLFNDVAMQHPGAMSTLGDYSSIRGTVAGEAAAVTNHIPTANSGITHLYYCIWMYVWCLMYSVVFLTIDDISLAVSGQTRITLNAFGDVAVRWPDAMNVVSHDTIP